eukprot:m.63303 g.63303  ORF g.63303 m.63303 type:complete len:427 (-) comp13967_c0_seq4:35-1315(-)
MAEMATLVQEVDAALQCDYIKALGDDLGRQHWLDLKRALTRPPSCTTARINQPGLSEADIKALVTVPFKYHATLPDTIVFPVVQHVVEPAAKAVVVGALCGMAVLRGSQVFLPGIKAIGSGICTGDLVSVYADLEGTCPRGLAEPFTGASAFVGNGIIQISRRQFFKLEPDKLGGLGIDMTQPCYETPSLGHCEPSLVLQNMPSIACGLAVQPEPGQTILDMCAAPGGKTAHLACLLQGQGKIVALERSKKRADALAQRVVELGHGDLVDVHCLNATRCLEGSKGGKLKFPPASFDRVLLDAPCSALGQRPRFSITTILSLVELEQFGSYACKLLQVAAKAVKPGGRVVFSTCTLNPRENEHVVAWALTNLPDLELVRAEPYLGHSGLANHGLSEEQRHLVQRFDPIETDTIGFFVACFQRKFPTE